MTLSRCIVAEILGTAFLLAAAAGPGIVGEKLVGGYCYSLAFSFVASSCSAPALKHLG
jgi:hypothetical protein